MSAIIPAPIPARRRVVSVRRHPNGPRVYLLGRRIHHGLTGAVLAVASVLLPRRARHRGVLVILGAVLVIDDAHDFPWHTQDAVSPATARRN